MILWVVGLLAFVAICGGVAGYYWLKHDDGIEKIKKHFK
jgi:hypothetical protein